MFLYSHHAAVPYFKGFAPTVLQDGQRYVNPNSKQLPLFFLNTIQSHWVEVCFWVNIWDFVGSVVREDLQKVISDEVGSYQVEIPSLDLDTFSFDSCWNENNPERGNNNANFQFLYL